MENGRRMETGQSIRLGPCQDGQLATRTDRSPPNRMGGRGGSGPRNPAAAPYLSEGTYAAPRYKRCAVPWRRLGDGPRPPGASLPQGGLPSGESPSGERHAHVKGAGAARGTRTPSNRAQCTRPLMWAGIVHGLEGGPGTRSGVLLASSAQHSTAQAARTGSLLVLALSVHCQSWSSGVVCWLARLCTRRTCHPRSGGNGLSFIHPSICLSIYLSRHSAHRLASRPCPFWAQASPPLRPPPPPWSLGRSCRSWPPPHPLARPGPARPRLPAPPPRAPPWGPC